VSFFDFLAGNPQSQEDAQANIDRLDAAIQAQSANDPARAAADNQFIQNAGNADSTTAAYVSGFGEGLNDGISNVRGTIGDLISGVFRLIPWQAWLVLLAVGFMYLGGLPFLKRTLSKL
jgi:hypothetical protein